MSTLTELGDEYAAEAERLKRQIARLKRRRKKAGINTGIYAELSRKIETLESMYDEAHDTAIKLQNYYKKPSEQSGGLNF